MHCVLQNTHTHSRRKRSGCIKVFDGLWNGHHALQASGNQTNLWLTHPDTTARWRIPHTHDIFSNTYTRYMPTKRERRLRMRHRDLPLYIKHTLYTLYKPIFNVISFHKDSVCYYYQEQTRINFNFQYMNHKLNQRNNWTKHSKQKYKTNPSCKRQRLTKYFTANKYQMHKHKCNNFQTDHL